MKNRIALIMAAAACAVCLAGCTEAIKTTEVSETKRAAESGEATAEDAFETGEVEMSEPGSVASETAETESAEAAVTEDAETIREADTEAGEGTDSGEVAIENPGWEYYFAGRQKASASQPEPSASRTVTLQKESEQKNQITDEEAWFAVNGLTKPGFPYEDDTYRYDVYGDNGFDVYHLVLSDAESGEKIADLDFSAYRYADRFIPEDIDFISQRICWAKAEGGVLYAATAHNTYAESSPDTAYLTAIDLTDFHVIWKTEPLISNASSFEIIGDAVVCGYGFTAEDDFLNIIDKTNGKLAEQIPIASKADYIIRKDDVLYVRTYHTDYMFKILVEDEGK